VYMLPVYPAGEAVLKGYESKDLAEAVSHDEVEVCKPEFDELVTHLMETKKEGDLFITLGAGDVNKVSQLITDIFDKNN